MRQSILFGFMALAAVHFTHHSVVHGASSASAERSVLQDPALVTGTLPNGIRYYIRKNTTPVKRAELHLIVNAGSMQEDDDQQGFAHFLEHMAFNGTTHFPGNSVIDFVEHAGMNFGADLNAYTSFEETGYTLTVPTDDPKILGQGLQILEDWASGGITFDSSEVVAERGVVLGEWRQRLPDTASRTLRAHQLAVLFGPNAKIAQRSPIGLPELLKTANPAPIQRFYRDWYRPDLMAVIAVGDFDPQMMVQHITDRFGRIPAARNPRVRNLEVPVVPDSTVVDVFRGRVAPTAAVLWRRPTLSTETRENLRRELIEQLLVRNLQQTFNKIRERSRRPFYAASFGITEVGRGRESYMIRVATTPDSLMDGMQAALTEIERIAQHGIPDQELERLKALLNRYLKSAADGEVAMSSKQIAKSYAENFLSGQGSLLSPSQEYALAKDILPAITSSHIADIARLWKTEAQRTVMMTIPAFAPVASPSRENVLAVLGAISQSSLASQNSDTDRHSASASANQPIRSGTIIREQHHARAGITEWTLSNGARVLYKPTNFQPDEFIVRAHSFGGASLLPDSLFFNSGRLVGMMMTATAQNEERNKDFLNSNSDPTLVRALQVSINYTDEEIVLNGSPRDVDAIFQRLYQQFTIPTLDTAAVSAWKQYGRSTLTQSANDQLARIVSRGHPRLTPPSLALVDLIDVNQAMTVYRDRFGDASDFTFFIVGAATPESVKLLVERYVASLPSSGRTVREQPKDPNVRPWNGKDIREIRDGRLHDQRAVAARAFDGIFPTAPDSFLLERRRLSTVTTILKRRLREQLREKLSATYGVAVSNSLYLSPQQHYRLTIEFDAEPDRIHELNDVVTKALDSLRTYGATPDELNIVSAIQRRSFETQSNTNGFWLGNMLQFDRLGISLDRIPENSDQPITSNEIRQAAARYLPDDSYVQLIFLPASKKKS